MNFDKLPSGKNPPHEINVVIEIPIGGDPVKYEYDKEVGALFVDRFMNTSMRYPCNYGFIPNTLSGDGDPIDVLLYSNCPIKPGAVVPARPIGVLITEDEKGSDAKILAVPTTKVDPFFSNILSYENLPSVFLRQIEHFFEHYKDLDPDKWVKVDGWRSKEEAYKLIEQSISSACVSLTT